MWVNDQEILFPFFRELASAKNPLRTGIVITAHHDGRSLLLEMGFDGGKMLVEVLAATNMKNFARNVIEGINYKTNLEKSLKVKSGKILFAISKTN